MKCTRCKGTGRVSTVDMTQSRPLMQCTCGMCFGQGVISVKDWLWNRVHFIVRKAKELCSSLR